MTQAPSNSATTTVLPRAGFIGLGQMGAPIARRLIEQGASLTVFDVREDVVQDFVNKGARRASSAEELAGQVDVVFSCLPSPQVVLASAEAVAASSAPVTYVELSSAGPQTIQEAARRLEAAGIPVVDAPCTGGLQAAREGRLTLMVAAEDAAFEKALPLLQLFASFIERVGVEPGQGQIAKLVNNTITFTTAAVTAEVLVAGAKAGLDPAAMLRIINHGSGRSEMSSRRFAKVVLPRTFDAGAFLPNGLKDLTLFMELARSVDARSPMAEAAANVRRQAVELLGPRADSSEEIKLYEHWAGIELPARRIDE